MVATNKLEYSIRRGYYRKNADGTFSVHVFYGDFDFWEKISPNNFAHINDVIRRKDWRSACDHYAGEHIASMSDITAAYDDYKMSLAY